MKICYLSDNHLEFYDTNHAIKTLEYLNSLKDECDFLVLAGDLHSKKIQRDYFLSQIETPHKYVMGNHDFLKMEVFDDFFDEDGIVGGCLWTNFHEDPVVEYEAHYKIWDYKWIKNWSTTQCKQLHYEQKRKIFESPSEIVVTHFPPSMLSVTEQFKGDSLNKYFCNGMEEEILNSNKKLWIHGHVHSDHDYMIGNCRVVCNPMGYPNELKKYKAAKIIEI